MRKIYIAGKIKGLPTKDVREKFRNAEKTLSNMGYVCFNPFSYIEEVNENRVKNGFNKLKDDNPQDRAVILKICTRELIKCDNIFFLNDWSDSEGAIYEKMVADKTGVLTLEPLKEEIRKKDTYPEIGPMLSKRCYTCKFLEQIEDSEYSKDMGDCSFLSGRYIPDGKKSIGETYPQEEYSDTLKTGIESYGICDYEGKGFTFETKSWYGWVHYNAHYPPIAGSGLVHIIKPEHGLANKFIKELLEAGYTPDDITAVFRDGKRQYEDYKKRKQQNNVKKSN